MKKLDLKFDRLESKVDGLEIGQKEIYQVVNALEHSAEVNKAEHDRMSIGFVLRLMDLVTANATLPANKLHNHYPLLVAALRPFPISLFDFPLDL